jgi:DNA-directed RNA polymerase subunit F
LPKEIIEEKPIPIAAAKRILENLNRELNQFQRRTLEYGTTFSKIEPDKAAELVEKLTKELDITVRETVQIVNSMPETIEELRIFIPRHKVIETSKLKTALTLMNKYRR